MLRACSLSLVLLAVLALPALAEEEATSSASPGRFLQVQAAIGMLPREGKKKADGTSNPIPDYYSSIGVLFETAIFPPLGVRVGGQMYPSGFNEWGVTPGSSFSGYGGNVDLTLAAARTGAGGPLPFIALGNRLDYLTHSDAARPIFSTFSLSLIIGVRLPTGLAVETRYPLVRTGDPDFPASFETTIGYWKGF